MKLVADFPDGPITAVNQCKPTEWVSTDKLFHMTLVGFDSCGRHEKPLNKEDDTPGLMFDGRFDFLHGPSVYFSTTASYTLAAWFYPMELSNRKQELIDSCTEYFVTPGRMMIQDGKFGCAIEVPTGQKIFEAISDQPLQEKWYFGSCVYDHKSRVLMAFLNGVVQKSVQIGSEDVLSSRVQIGANPVYLHRENFRGAIYFASLYNRSLKKSEIKELCESSGKRHSQLKCGF